MNKLESLAKWAKKQRKDTIEWSTCGRLCMHIYKRKLIDGGVELNLRIGTPQDEADVKIEERRPGVFTVAVVSCNGGSIDYTKRKEFALSEPIEALREAFPDGRNIGLIVDELLAVDGD